MRVWSETSSPWCRRSALVWKRSGRVFDLLSNEAEFVVTMLNQMLSQKMNMGLHFCLRSWRREKTISCLCRTSCTMGWCSARVCSTLIRRGGDAWLGECVTLPQDCVGGGILTQRLVGHYLYLHLAQPSAMSNTSSLCCYALKSS